MVKDLHQSNLDYEPVEDTLPKEHDNDSIPQNQIPPPLETRQP